MRKHAANYLAWKLCLVYDTYFRDILKSLEKRKERCNIRLYLREDVG